MNTIGGYLYVYFRGDVYGNGESQHVHMALSKDGLHFKAFRDNPVLIATKGTKGVRDPHLFYNKLTDKYYVIGTDLDSNEGEWAKYSNNASLNICVWESDDLVNWSDEYLIPLAEEGSHFMWAPTVVFDKDAGDYIVLWSSASKLYPQGKCIYYAHTKDFHSYSQPEIFKEVELNAFRLKSMETGEISPYITFIDSTIMEYDGKYYHFVKREQDVTVRLEVSNNLYKNYEVVKNVIAGEYGVEGPSIYPLPDGKRWILMLDGYCASYKNKGYMPYIAESVEALDKGEFRKLKRAEFTLPLGAKHGSFLPLTEEQFELLSKKL